MRSLTVWPISGPVKWRRSGAGGGASAGYIYARVLYITAVLSKPNHSRLPASSRTCNYVADTLASYECTLHGDSCYYMSHPPNFVLPLVLGDLPGTIVYWKFPSLSKKKSPWRERESRERKGNE
jgi:hypothetical protein